VRYWSAGQRALVAYALIAINFVVFVWMAGVNSDNLTGRRITQQDVDLGLFKELCRGGFCAADIGTVHGEWYRLISAGFLHFGILHIAFNMLLLFQLGNLLEPVVGRIRFGLLYFASLLGGAAGVLVLSPHELTGGASGAVFGLLGAAAVALWLRGVNPLSTGIGTLIVLNLFITFTLPNVSIGGHLGGLIAGAAAGWFVAAPKHRRVPVAVTYIAPLAVAVIALGIAYAAGSG
jgi:membrane associated rhomboid family serine protease